MIPEPVRAIFFDAVGTLIHPHPGAAEVYWNIGRKHGSRHDLDQIARRFRAAFQKEEEADRSAGWRTSEDRERRRWRNIVAQVLDDVNDPEACFAELYEHFSHPQAWRLEPEAATVMPELARRGYVLGMASNYDHRLPSVIAGMPGLSRLQHVVISSEVGWRKPAPAFFAALSATTRLAAAQILYVGDDPENDYQGAMDAGLQGLLLDRAMRFPGFTGPRLGLLSELMP
jgi:putative hydrolase of the HAD superfamily